MVPSASPVIIYEPISDIERQGTWIVWRIRELEVSKTTTRDVLQPATNDSSSFKQIDDTLKISVYLPYGPTGDAREWFEYSLGSSFEFKCTQNFSIHIIWLNEFSTCNICILWASYIMNWPTSLNPSFALKVWVRCLGHEEKSLVSATCDQSVCSMLIWIQKSVTKYTWGQLPFIQWTAVTILVWMSSGTEVFVGECWLVGSISITWTNLSRPPVAKKFCFQLRQRTSALWTWIREWNFQSSVRSAWYSSTLPFSRPSAENFINFYPWFQPKFHPRHLETG